MTNSTDNLVSLKEYFDRRLSDLERQIASTERNNDAAIRKADEVLTYRLEGMNEWRASLSDMTSRYVVRTEFLNLRDYLYDKIETLQKNQAMIVGGLITLQAVVLLLQIFLWYFT